MAVSAMVIAMAAVMSLCVTSWALAAPARLDTTTAASAIAAACNRVLETNGFDMSSISSGTAAAWLAGCPDGSDCYGWIVPGWSVARSLQIGGDLVDADFCAGFVLVAARGAGYAHRAD